MPEPALSAMDDPQQGREHARQLKLWLGLLCFAELADLMTTHADRVRGGVEANQVSAFTLAVGGPGLYWGLKLGLVLAMAVVVVLALHFARNFPGRRAKLIQNWIERSIQVCVVTLTIAAIGNVVVLAVVLQNVFRT
jgi:hypothetical protein